MPSSRCVPCRSRSIALPMSCSERGPHGDVRVEPELLRHHAREERHFLRVVQHVLPVAGPEFQAAHQPVDVRMHVVEPELEGGGFAFLAHRLFHLGFHFLDDLLDPRRMNAPVGNQPLDGLPRDLAAVAGRSSRG